MSNNTQGVIYANQPKLWQKAASSKASIELVNDVTVKRVESRDIFGKVIATVDYPFRDEVLMDGDRQYKVAISEWLGKTFETKTRILADGTEQKGEVFQNIDAYDIIPDTPSDKDAIIALMDRAGYYYDEKGQQLASDGVILVRRKNEQMHMEANRAAKAKQINASYEAKVHSIPEF